MVASARSPNQSLFSAKEELSGRILGSARELEAPERQDNHQALDNWL